MHGAGGWGLGGGGVHGHAALHVGDIRDRTEMAASYPAFDVRHQAMEAGGLGRLELIAQR